jgi:molybdopterin converting factor small subunit
MFDDELILLVDKMILDAELQEKIDLFSVVSEETKSAFEKNAGKEPLELLGELQAMLAEMSAEEQQMISEGLVKLFGAFNKSTNGDADKWATNLRDTMEEVKKDIKERCGDGGGF